MARKLTDLRVAKTRPTDKRQEIPDGGARGLYLVIQPEPYGTKSYCVRYRYFGKSRKLTLPAGISLAEARKAAADAILEVERGNDPAATKMATRAKAAAAAADTLQAVCEEYLKREGGRLRTAEDRAAILARHVYDAIGSRPIASVGRTEIIRLLDRIEDNSGPRAADMVLAVLRKIMNWHAARSDTFRSPIVRGMARVRPAECARSRILNDDELRKVWKTASEDKGPFAALVRFLLLTGARRNEASELTWSEISGSDWTLPAARNKTKIDLVRPLSSAAMAVLEAQPQIDGSKYVFTTTGRAPLSGFSKFKRKFDQKCGVTDFTLHDLRRTARSLMSRQAGINSDHAERALGHVIGGVRGVYDRHEYHAEKKHAFEALAAQIERIINPPKDGNVRHLRVRS